MDGTKMDARGVILGVWLALSLVLLTAAMEPGLTCVFAIANLALCAWCIRRYENRRKADR